MPLMIKAGVMFGHTQRMFLAIRSIAHFSYGRHGSHFSASMAIMPYYFNMGNWIFF